MIQLREYQPKDWNAIATIHDRSRLDELIASVGIEAFLSLAETAENEGLFEGEIWVACDDDIVVIGHKLRLSFICQVFFINFNKAFNLLLLLMFEVFAPR